MKFNKYWQLQHPMQVNPTIEQKVEWHLAHQKNCSCRPIPAKLAAEMKEKGIELKT